MTEPTALPDPGASWSAPALHTFGGRALGGESWAPGWGPTTYGGRRGVGRHRSRTAAGVDGIEGTDSEQREVVARSRSLAVASLVSRITGLLRSLALAAALGVAANSIADPYNGANSFPNMVYELLLGGVLSSVVIPVIVHAQEHDEDGGDAYTQRLLSVATAALGVATLLAALAAPLIAWLFVSEPAKRDLTSVFATLLLPEIFFYGLGAMIAAVLNTRGVFGPPAWAPVLNNVIVLATIGAFVALPPHGVPTLSTVTTGQVLLLGIGTTAGIAVQAVCLFPALRRAGFRWRWRFRAAPGDSGRMREFRALTYWVLGYVALSQAGTAVITRVAFSHDGLSTFTYAALLFQVPYGVIGVSILTGLMPKMSRAATRGDTDELAADLRLGARLSGLTLIPITAALIVLGPTLATVIFLGHTTVAQARLIGTVVAMAAFGLLPLALVMLQMRAFYALRDARTPTLVNAVMIAVEVALVLAAAAVLHGDRVIEALGVATSASYLLGAVLGHVLLRRRVGRLGFAAVLRLAIRVTLGSALAGAAAYVVVRVITTMAGDGRVGALAALIAATLAGGAVFAVAARAMRISELRELLANLR